jgi:pSer/pThr/pTyr-binding forkhead associated (FHA) protein
MSKSQDPISPVAGEGSTANPELTTTIHLSALRSVPKPRPLEEVFGLLSSEDRSVVGQLAHESSMLVVIAGPSKGSRFLIDSESVAIGRSAEADICLDDVTVSRTHAKINRTANGDYEISDCQSLNGTYLNGTAITESRLAVGDEIQIGKFRLTYFNGKGNS